MIFIAGLTGRVGGAAATTLLDQGYSVRALVRDPAQADDWVARGVDVRSGDLTDPDALGQALEGVDAAFLMQPTPVVVDPTFPLAHALTASFVRALRQAPPPRLVVLSSIGSEKPVGLGNIAQTYLLEQALDGVVPQLAIVRAGAFLENVLGSLAPAAVSGWFDSFLQPTDRPVPMIATLDIGQAVARLLIDGWEGQPIIELGSPVRPDDLAEAMSSVTGQAIQARPIPRDQWVARLLAMGFPPGQTGMWEQMHDSFNSGWIDFGRAGTIPVPGKTTPTQVFAEAWAARR